MRVRKATRLTLMLLAAASMGVSGAAAGQAAQSSKPSSAKHRSKSTHGHSYHRTSRREHGQKAPTADRVSEIQSALAKDGSLNGTPNGKWDSATVDAMKKFQTSHGLSPTGKLDAKTLQKLGLGSQTAGLAPPLPPVSSTSLTTSPSTTVRQPQ
ncbi:MAG: peptidoglycan-binding domain-containing protein [Candidatus Acidiferrum sp.]